MFLCVLGDAHLASPQDKECLLESPLQEQTSSYCSLDSGYHPTSRGELFFDQVAELEKVISGESCKGNVSGKPWGANGALFDGIQENMEESVGLAEMSDHEQDVDACSSSVLVTGRDRAPNQKEGLCLEMFEQQPSNHSSLLPCGDAVLFDESQGSPASVASSGSDEASEKRIRNNQASRKFRRIRKERHKTLFARASKLERENQLLKLQVNEMTREVVTLRSMFPNSIIHIYM